MLFRWDIAPTQAPNGADLWQIHPDGRQELVSAYAGPAFGWRSTGVYVPPSIVSGPRARRNGVPAHIVQSNAQEAVIVLAGDASQAGAGAVVLEPGLVWRVVPRSELADVRGTTNELEPA